MPINTKREALLKTLTEMHARLSYLASTAEDDSELASQLRSAAESIDRVVELLKWKTASNAQDA